MFYSVKFKNFLVFSLLLSLNIAVANVNFAWATNSEMSQQLWGGLTKEDVARLKQFNNALRNNDADSLIAIANQAKSNSSNQVNNNSNFADALLSIGLWNKYSQSKINSNRVAFNDISRFVNDNPFFPNLSDLRKNVEKVAIANNIPYSFTQQYFNNFPATNASSKIYLLKSEIDYLNNSNNPNFNNKQVLQKTIDDLITEIWVDENFSDAEEAKFLEIYGKKLTTDDHVRRITRLLWDNKFGDAERIFYLVGDDYKRLFSAIIELSSNPKSIESVVLSVPRSLRGSDLLAYEIIIWQKARISSKNSKDVDKLVNLLTKIPSTADHPEKWWILRNAYAREMIKRRDYKTAYLLASNHGLRAGSNDFADAEWLAGWIALRFLNKPEIAYEHFNHLYLNVTYPVSISRAAYWLGMSSQALGDKQKAIDWYKIAAQYPTYFYGQLAIHKHHLVDSAGSINDIVLPKDPDITGEDIKAISREMSVKIAYVLALIGDTKSATKIFEYAVNAAKTDGQIAVIMKVVNEMNNRGLDVKISKFAAKRNVVFIKDKFQIIKEIQNDKYAPLVHAIIKQESGFATSALSSVGAVGFMQLMPDTAKLVCRQVGVNYSRNKLARDINYNVILGSYYIKSLIDQFNGSEVMAIAAYNAGPQSVQRWVTEFYDPRKVRDLDKVVDWIELITYPETRNYVQRIEENLIVYKYLMSRTNYDEVK